MEKLNTVCPGCGKNSLVKKQLPDGKYMIVCMECGLERGPFPPDNKKGVV